MVKVLFIDDEPTAHKTLELVLPDPYVLISAYSARHGMEVLERDGPDVVLLDINLPDRDDIALLCEIQARPYLPAAVMLTATSIRQYATGRENMKSCGETTLKSIVAGSRWQFDLNPLDEHRRECLARVVERQITSQTVVSSPRMQCERCWPTWERKPNVAAG